METDSQSLTPWRVVVYYLVKPDDTVWSSDASDFVIDRLRQEHPDSVLDLGNLDWQSSTQVFDAGLLNIALRKGVPVSHGIVLAAREVTPLDYYRDMLAILQKELARDSTDVPHADLFETLDEGWIERTKQLDNDVAAAQVKTVERARASLAALLKLPMSSMLVEHWQDLGGGLPPAVPADVADKL